MSIKRGISLYSYQQAYYNGELDLEGCIATAASTGATGIELIPEQMPVGNYPNPSEADVDRWFSWMDSYKTTPTCMDAFIDFKLYKGRKSYLTLKEQVQQMERDLKLASRLGFSLIRVLCKIHTDVIEAALPIAEYYNVKMGREIHPPVLIDSPYMEEYINMIERKNTKYAVIIPDFGLFARCPSDPYIEETVRNGATREIMYHTAKQIENRKPFAEIRKDIEKMGATPMDYQQAQVMDYVTKFNDPAKIQPLMKYISHFHGKCYDLDEDCNETTIDYPGVISILKKTGWDGYISTEYEGQRLFHDQNCAETANEIEQVRRHQMLMKRLIEC